MKLTDTELQLVSTLCKRQVEQEAVVADLEVQLKQAKEHLNYISQVELPNAMAELGVELVKLEDGSKIEVKQKYYASIPVEQRQKAFDWLTSHNYDSIIKNTVKCDFAKGENEQAKEAMRELISLGFRPVQDMNIHPMTLKSFVKDLIERGVEFPMDLFGAGAVNETKVTLVKK
jgi:hypothetical protein